jgi:hypothetical protein
MTEKTFHHGIVIAVAFATHAADHARALQKLEIPPTGV